MKKMLLEKVLNDIRSVKIAIVGDFCLDAYWFIDESKSEVSVETGHKTRPVSQQKYSLGGAGNVAANLAAMGVKEILGFGVIGPDPFGPKMTGLLKNINVNTNNILVQEENWYTHVYTKPYVGDDEQGRIDFGNFNKLSENTADELILRLSKVVPEIDLVIINQQVVSGIHTSFFRFKLAGLIKSFPDRIFISDSRNYSDEYTGAYRKMNDSEAVRLCDLKKGQNEIITISEISDSAKTLFKRYQKPVFVTCGSYGSLIVDENGVNEIPGLMILSKTDTVGAGDSYLAGAASALAAGHDMETAAVTGTLVAGVTIQKLFQTGTATPSEILSIGRDPDYIYSPELAENIRKARYIKDSEIEIVNILEKKLQVEHAIFDHDGTVSTLRQGWELIMAPMMIRAVLGKKFGSADESLFRRVKARVDEFIDKTTGIQTLTQMKGLFGLIREFGFVPENEMLDEFGYKRIYNEELMKMVKIRQKKFENQELTQEDLTIKSAIPILQKLYSSGIRLYLVSGTDEEDVKNEARLLGYDHLFEGRIFGAVGDVRIEAKKKVIDQILDTIGESSYSGIATFGDGPVEMRETRKRGGVAIGVASNELRRYGLNESKRSRLIKAGADIIVPDFSQFAHLLTLINIS